jgi:hypothetical protein
MKRLIVLIVASVLVAGLWRSSVNMHALQSKPTKHNTLFTDGRVVPSTLRQMHAQADAVVKAIVNDGHSDDFLAASDVAAPLVATVYDVTVEEVLKPDSRIAPGPVVPVWRIGGKRDKGDHIELTDEDDFPLFKSGDEYVLFLKWKESRRAFEIVGGPNGAFRLTQSHVDSSGTSPVAKQEKGVRVDDFLNKLRGLR